MPGKGLLRCDLKMLLLAGDVEATLAVCNHLLLTGLTSEQQPEFLKKFAAAVTTQVHCN